MRNFACEPRAIDLAPIGGCGASTYAEPTCSNLRNVSRRYLRRPVKIVSTTLKYRVSSRGAF
jgi:hypothetical protein